MQRDLSISFGPTIASSQTKRMARSLTPWLLIAFAIVFICALLTLDASLTAEQRHAVYLQSGVFP